MIKKIEAFITARAFVNFILVVILLNAAVLGMQTSKELMQRVGPLLILIDAICLAIFTGEIFLKLVVKRFRFFLSGWNNFDFVIVGISLIPGANGLSVLRAMRIMRVLRVISVVPSLRRVVDGFIKALPGMISVFVLTMLIFYIAGVMATQLFGKSFPQWFGTLGESYYSLFQIMTLESWSMGIVRPVMEIYPYAWAFFVPFILITTFAVVNLVVGLIVTAMEGENEAQDNKATDEFRNEIMTKLKALDAKIDAMGQKR